MPAHELRRATVGLTHRLQIHEVLARPEHSSSIALRGPIAFAHAWQGFGEWLLAPRTSATRPTGLGNQPALNPQYRACSPRRAPGPLRFSILGTGAEAAHLREALSQRLPRVRVHDPEVLTIFNNRLRVVATNGNAAVRAEPSFVSGPRKQRWGLYEYARFALFVVDDGARAVDRSAYDHVEQV